MAHALISPSAAYRAFECPASLHESEGEPNPDTKYSRRGTFLHSLAETTLRRGGARLQGKDYTDALLVAAEKSGLAYEPTRLDLDQVARFVSAVTGAFLLSETPAQLFIEQRVTLNPQVWGTADALIIDVANRKMTVFDLKTGAQFVNAEENIQLGIYAVAALAERGVDLSEGQLDWHVELVICQGEEPSSWVAPMAWLRMVRARALELTMLYLRGEHRKLYKPGSHCDYCLGKHKCAALHQQAMVATQAIFTDLDATRPTLPPAPATMATPDLLKVVAASDLVEEWIKSVRGELERRALAGETIPGRKLVEKLGNRRWRSPDRAAEVLRAHGVDPYEAPELKSPAAVEKLSKALKPVVEQLVERPSNGLTLVPESDKRPAVASGSPFKALDN